MRMLLSIARAKPAGRSRDAASNGVFRGDERIHDVHRDFAVGT